MGQFMRVSPSILAILTVALPAAALAAPRSLWVETVSAPPKKVASQPKPRLPSPRAEFYEGYGQAKPQAPSQREESVEFLGFNNAESAAAFRVKVRETSAGKAQAFELIRLVSTENEEVLGTFRQGPPSSHPEWKAAKSPEAWGAFAARAELWSMRLHHARQTFRVAIDDGDKVADSLSTKKFITMTTAEGSGLGMTPVVRLYDGRLIWLTAIPRAAAQPGKSVTATITAYHSHTGMHVAVVANYGVKSPSGTETHTNDVTRLYAMPGDPIGTTTIGAFNMTAASEVIGERRFGELNPDFKQEFVRFGRD